MPEYLFMLDVILFFLRADHLTTPEFIDKNPGATG